MNNLPELGSCPSPMIEVQYHPKHFQTDPIEIRLPYSKSISNRSLILQALFPEQIQIDALSDSEDTRLLQVALERHSESVDFGMAGTSARFFLAYATLLGKSIRIDASGRGRQRPVKELFEALAQLGGQWEFEEAPFSFPCRPINPPSLGGEVQLRSDVSSQFISALMLIAPALSNGMRIHLTGKTVSQSYLDLTRHSLQAIGAIVQSEGNEIRIAPLKNLARKIVLKAEADWSSAAYVSQHLVLKSSPAVLLPNLTLQSHQADRVLVDYFASLGLRVKTEDNAIVMYRSEKQTNRKLFSDFVACPDLSIAWAAAVAGAGCNGQLVGLQTLRGKESDRWKGLLENLAPWCEIKANDQEWSIDIRQRNRDLIPKVWNTLGDHRFAMAGAILADIHQPVYLTEVDSVKKSFPTFPQEMEQLGYRFKSVE